MFRHRGPTGFLRVTDYRPVQRRSLVVILFHSTKTVHLPCRSVAYLCQVRSIYEKKKVCYYHDNVFAGNSR